ncbi:MAG: FAD-dependent oxidoreductase [Azospirillaceae bacterium]
MRIAIIGSGVSGLGAAWLLDPHHRVTIYEAAGRLGGHANTIMAPLGPDGPAVPVDTGFIVYNEHTYPNLTALFRTLDVPSTATAMSFAVSSRDGRLEYAGSSALHLYAQPRNLFRAAHHRMVRDILRFFREAPALLDEETEGHGPTLGAWLAANGYSEAFIFDHLLPMGAAIWSSTVAEMMRFPARSFVAFFRNHGLLSVRDRPQWRSVAGGSRTYVERIRKNLRGEVRTDSAAVSVRRLPTGVAVTDRHGETEVFDEVILACHADQALALLDDRDELEHRHLSAFRYEPNKAVLHSDTSLMPRRRRVWSAWNYLSRGVTQNDARLCVSYWMNRLQALRCRRPFFVTVNPVHTPAPDTVVAAFDYAHPQFDQAAVDAQASLGELQGRRHTWFCGSYFGYGFHEDGLASGLAVAEALGARRPWSITESSPAYANAMPRLPAGMILEAAE